MSETVKIVLTFFLSSTFVGFIQFLIQRNDNKHSKHEQYAEAIEELRGVMTQLASTTKEQQQIITANSKLLVGLAQDRLVFLTDKYLKRGVITLDELAILEEIYEPYHDKLNGNGRGKAGIEMCRKLPIVSDEIAIIKDKEGN